MENLPNALDAEVPKPLGKLCDAIPMLPTCLATESSPQTEALAVFMDRERD